MKTRIIYSDNGVLTDLTSQLNDYSASSKAFAWNGTEDAMYLGSIYPFTSKYFKRTTPNTVASTATVSYWDGTTWRAASNQIDETGLSGTPFSNSGYINLRADKRYPWVSDDTTDNGVEQITGLSGITIYDMYWIKITYSSNIAMTLSWIGDVFCKDTDLKLISPSVMGTTFMDDWESGKTGWEDQRVSATQLLIEESKGHKLNSEALYLDKDELTLATTFRTLAVIYGEMGDVDKFSMYMDRVDKLTRQSFSKDTNMDGRANPDEVGIRPTQFRR